MIHFSLWTLWHKTNFFSGRGLHKTSDYKAETRDSKVADKWTSQTGRFALKDWVQAIYLLQVTIHRPLKKLVSALNLNSDARSIEKQEGLTSFERCLKISINEEISFQNNTAFSLHLYTIQCEMLYTICLSSRIEKCTQKQPTSSHVMKFCLQIKHFISLFLERNIFH